jgi:NADP-dependent 3-hydroxy acid dehydrogenase YdfG
VGIAQVKPMLDLTEEDVDTMFAVNTKGVLKYYLHIIWSFEN